jgi:HEAT repeat protein
MSWSFIQYLKAFFVAPKQRTVAPKKTCPPEALSPQAILALESKIRASWSSYYEQDRAYEADPAQAKRVSTLSANGRNREKAIRALAASADKGALPFILLRLNDWVPQVRTAAEKWFDTLGDLITAPDLVESLPILAALSERSQGASSKRVVLLLERVANEAPTEELVKSLLNGDPRARVLALLILTKKGLLEDFDMQARLLRHPDPIPAVLMMKSFRDQSRKLPSTTIRLALASRSAMIRRSALYQLSTTQLAEYQDLLPELLKDDSKGVRQFAQFHLTKSRPKEDVLAQYEALLSHPNTPARLVSVAIQGFHECGGKWPVERYELLAKHNSARVRQTIMSAFGSVWFEAALPWIRSVLESPIDSPLAKTAYSLVRRQPHAVPLSVLRDWALDGHKTDAARFRALTLICNRSKCEQLPALLQLLQAYPALFGDRVRLRLQAWLADFNRSQIQPTRQQIEEAQRLLEGAAPHLDDMLKREFHALLSGIVCTH